MNIIYNLYIYNYYFQALLEERRCHCFVLQRLCAISELSMIGHRHGLEMYRSLPEWHDVCSNPHVLMPAAEQLIADHMVHLHFSQFILAVILKL